MGKGIYILNLSFTGLIYILSMRLSASQLVLSSLYLFSTVVFTVLYLKQSRASSFVPLITFLYYPFYEYFYSGHASTSIIIREIVLSLLGLIPSVLIIYRGRGKEVANVIGILLVSLYLPFSIFLWLSAPASFRQTVGSLLLNPLFIPASFSTLRSLGYGIPRSQKSTPQHYAAQPQYTPQLSYPQVQQYPSYTQMPYQPSNTGSLSVTFIFRGLPAGCYPVIHVNGKRYQPKKYFQGDYVFYFHEGCTWNAGAVTCGATTYLPDRQRGKADLGSSVIITYRPAPQGHGPSQTIPQSPSRPLTNKGLGNWDPNVWVGRTLSVYNVKKVIGEGGNGYVLKANYSGKQLAIKVLKLYGGNPEAFFKELATEASNLVNLSNHKNIVKVYAVKVDTFVINEVLRGRADLYLKDPPMIVMEFMSGGTLKDLLDDDMFYYSSKWQKSVLKAVCEVAQALDYVHSQGFVHMDVKPQNIFLNEKPKDPSGLDNVEFKLGDLGSAVRVNGDVKQVTVEYSPPEVYVEKAKPYFDIYALGMTMYTLLTRKIDRPDLNEMESAFNCYVKNDIVCVKDEVIMAKAKLSRWDVSVDPQVDNLLKLMLSDDPRRRPTAKEVIDAIKRVDPTLC
ncbi:protein kinase domain-containing protein [Stygiolobus caldivivus]|uniref:protein kinase domain-containing protein n=1 Tax=Stygiolobus caldivivus TaxID=2824673 RepID=UPI001C863245|nr:protein kinase [Stygiolobus caldivivus]